METAEMTDENVVFEAWREAPDDDKMKFLPQLVQLLQNHAGAVIWQKLQTKRPDLVNEAVWGVLEFPEKFKGESEFSTWFQAIVQHKCVDALRENYDPLTKGEVSLEDAGDLATAAENIVSKIDMERLLLNFKKRDRVLVQLQIEGNSFDEIAQKLGHNAGYWRQRWDMLKKQVQKKLKHFR